MIKPTVGRKVWYRPAVDDAGMVRNGDDPLDATVVAVHSDKMVNLSIFDANGTQHVRHSVDLVQDGAQPPSDIGYCEWMPYQISQAKASE